MPPAVPVQSDRPARRRLRSNLDTSTYNGYIPAKQINSVNKNGVPNGIEAVPSNYVPAVNTLDRLMGILNRLGSRIEVKVRVRRERVA